MEALITREQRDKKVKRNQLLIGLVLIMLMVFSTLGFAFGNKLNDNIEEVEYNDIEFVRNPQNGYWEFIISDVDFVTSYNPLEVEDVSITSTLTLHNYISKPLYYVGISGEHYLEIDRNLRGRYVERTSNACLDNECKGDYPIKDCSIDNIIIFEESEENERIYQDGNCVYIVSSFSNQVRFADAYLFNLLGVR